MSDPLLRDADRAREAETFAAEWIDAFNSLDLERILSHDAEAGLKDP